jgi:RNA recognition motif-containing protein
LEEAKLAITKFDGKELDGRILKVSYHKRSRKERTVGSTGNRNPRLAGDTTTDAPPPEKKKKEKGK